MARNSLFLSFSVLNKALYDTFGGLPMSPTLSAAFFCKMTRKQVTIKTNQIQVNDFFRTGLFLENPSDSLLSTLLFLKELFLLILFR